MTVTDKDLLEQLQSWYSSQCNGEWEHSFGLAIQTLDNPGWSLKVELGDTSLANKHFDEIHVDGIHKDDWYVCRVRECKFEAFCGPNRLRDVLSIFLGWAGFSG